VINLSQENGSNGEKGGSQSPPEKVTITEKVIPIDVRRSTVEKELQQDLQDAAVEKQKLVDQLTEINKELEELRTSKTTDTEKLGELEKERDKFRDEVTAIALAEFQKEKEVLLESLKTRGIPEERITEIDEKLQSPVDYEKIKWYFEFLGEMMTKAQTDDEKAEAERLEREKLEAEKKGTTPGSPPGGSQVDLEPPKTGSPTEFDSYREMIGDLHDRMNKGDPEAKKQYDALWKMVPDAILKLTPKFAILECPECGKGMFKGKPCPWCGFDARAKGIMVGKRGLEV